MNMKEKLTIIKVGGKIVEEEDSLRQLLAAFTAVEGNKILVHGGGRSATKVAAQLGIESQMINGRRVTDADMLNVVTMVYGGLVNKTPSGARCQRLRLDRCRHGCDTFPQTSGEGCGLRFRRRRRRS